MWSMVLVMLCQQVEVPKYAAKYFERADAIRARAIEEQEEEIKKAEIAMNGEKIRERRGALKRRIELLEKGLTNFKKLPVVAELPLVAVRDDVGVLNGMIIDAIVDEKYVILRSRNPVFPRRVVVEMDTKGMKVRTPFASEVPAYRVKHRVAEDAGLPALNAGVELVKGQYSTPVLEPISKSDLESWRAAYDAQQAAKEPTPKK